MYACSKVTRSNKYLFTKQDISKHKTEEQQQKQPDSKKETQLNQEANNYRHEEPEEAMKKLEAAYKKNMFTFSTRKFSVRICFERIIVLILRFLSGRRKFCGFSAVGCVSFVFPMMSMPTENRKKTI